MGMFTNYQAELLEHYQPNNLVNSFSTPVFDSKLNSIDASKPYEEYNAKGELVGYSWSQGSTLNLDFSIEGEITVEPDAIISTTKGDTPDGIVVSVAGKRYYNLIDFRSWSSYIIDEKVAWIEDTEFKYPESGIDLKSIYMPVTTYLKDKLVTVTLYNFRMEPVHTWHPVVNNSRVVCAIDKDLSSKLTRGVYYCSLVVENDTAKFTLFDSNDCLLLVK